MAIELEVKYRCPEAVQAAVSRSFGEDFQVTQMRTTYYDTPDRSLAARHWTLRRRREDSRSICTLKMPAGAARAEYEVEAAAIGEALPRLSALSGQALEALPIGPVCGAEFVRRSRLIRGEGFTAELALDLGRLTGGSAGAPIAELEVELKSGSAEAMLGWAAALAARFDLVPEPKSKFARARALAEGGSHG